MSLSASLKSGDHHQGRRTEGIGGFASVLDLDPTNPGLKDPKYIARRADLYHLARKCRLEGLPFPDITYEEDEHEIWRIVWHGLKQAHEKWACSAYLRGKEMLSLSPARLPRLVDLRAQLQRETAVDLVSAEGLMDYPEFFAHLAQRAIPCTLYLRHGSQPQYATEPDLVHDVFGHFPMLANRDYVDFITLVGQASQLAQTDEELLAFNRLYFFTIEFGLIVENGATKVFGAGLLSSYGEMQHAYSGNVEWRPLDIDDLVKRSYDPYSMQNVFYVMQSFEELVEATDRFIQRHVGVSLEQLKDASNHAHRGSDERAMK